MRKFSTPLIAFVLLATPLVQAAESETEVLWSGDHPAKLVQTYEATCGGTTFKLSLETVDGKRINAAEFSRSPEALTVTIERKLNATIFQFRKINEVVFDCGLSSQDDPNAKGRTYDFSGQIDLTIIGEHRTSTAGARKQCERLNGYFDHRTTRRLLIKNNSIEDAGPPSGIGSCVVANYSGEALQELLENSRKNNE